MEPNHRRCPRTLFKVPIGRLEEEDAVPGVAQCINDLIVWLRLEHPSLASAEELASGGV
jgi:hypothetical protein